MVLYKMGLQCTVFHLQACWLEPVLSLVAAAPVVVAAAPVVAAVVVNVAVVVVVGGFG